MKLGRPTAGSGKVIAFPDRRTRPQPKPAQPPAASGKPDPGGKSREPRR